MDPLSDYVTTSPTTWYDRVSGNTVYWVAPAGGAPGSFTTWIGQMHYSWGRLQDGSYGWVPNRSMIRERERAQRESAIRWFLYIAIAIVILGVSANFGQPAVGAVAVVLVLGYLTLMEWLSNHHPLAWAAIVGAGVASALKRTGR